MSASPIWIAGYFGARCWGRSGLDCAWRRHRSFGCSVSGCELLRAGRGRDCSLDCGLFRPSSSGDWRDSDHYQRLGRFGRGRASTGHLGLVRRRRCRQRHDVEQRRADGDAKWRSSMAVGTGVQSARHLVSCILSFQPASLSLLHLPLIFLVASLFWHFYHGASGQSNYSVGMAVQGAGNAC